MRAIRARRPRRSRRPTRSVADYLKVRARLGIARTVVVQPSTYGTDNRCTLAAIAALGDSARGIAVVDQTVTDAELDRLTKAGIRGIRFHMLPGGALPWDILETMAARVGNFGWHVQLQLDGRTLPDREPLLKKLTGTLVVDHVGKFLEPVHDRSSGLQGAAAACSTTAAPGSSSPRPTNGRRPARRIISDVGKLAYALSSAAPDRMLWATNWPHPTPGLPQARRRVAARHDAGMGARRGDAEQDAGRQSGAALWILTRLSGRLSNAPSRERGTTSQRHCRA